MKRSPMKRSTTPMKRGGRLPQESTRRKAERPTRTAVREAALAAAGHRCSGVEIVPEIDCWGPLDVDEIKSRGVNPGGHLDDSNVQVLCRAHHDWRTQNPREARERGLRLESWEQPGATVEPAANGFSDSGDSETSVLAPANGLPVHDARGGTVDWMCRAIQLPDGRRFYAASSMIDDGILIPPETLKEACEPDYEGDDPFPVNACFCCVDAETILNGIGWTFKIDELGDHVVTGRR